MEGRYKGNMVKQEIHFTFVGEDGENLDFVSELGLESMTFEEFFKKAVVESKKANNKLRSKFGNDTIWTPEKEAFLTKEENLWVRMGHNLKLMAMGKVGIKFDNPKN